jgi:hypothetical protein
MIIVIGRLVTKATDLGEKLDPLDVVFGRDKPFQPAVIAGKGSVFGWWC